MRRPLRSVHAPIAGWVHAPTRQAIILGLIHGPAELAPVSSSAHTALVPWLLGWERAEPAARKRLEVALHAGALRLRRPALPAHLIALACAPPAIAGLVLERPIERRFGTPATIAAGLAAGAGAMWLAERRPGGRESATARDALVLGVAQALALIPGVSRSGAARAAARWRGFGPERARELADDVGLPITAAAVALKGREALRDRRQWPALAAGAAAAFVSTRASEAARGDAGSLRPFACYRLALAAAVVRGLRQNGRR
jgi:undecaprenyl-diphosphatase